MSNETREKYLTAVNVICEQFGLDKPSQIIYVCEAVDNLIEEYRKENEELKETVSRAGYRIAELKHENDEMKDQNKTILEDNDTLNKWVDDQKATIDCLQLNLSSTNDTAEEQQMQIEKLIDFIVPYVSVCDLCESSDACGDESVSCLIPDESINLRELVIKHISRS